MNKTMRNVIIIIVLLLTAYFLSPLVTGKPAKTFDGSKELKLGLDLQGGMLIRLEVDNSKLPDDEKDAAVSAAEEIIRNRIDQFGVAEPSVQRAGDNRINVQLPGLKDFGRAKDLIGKTALLEFKLLAPQDKVKDTYERIDKYIAQHLDKYAYATSVLDGEDTESVDILGEDADSVGTSEEIDYSDVFSSLANSFGMGRVSAAHVPIIKKLLKDPEIKKQVSPGFELALEKEDKRNPNNGRILFLMYRKAELTGKYLESARASIGQGMDPKTSGKPYVSLKFNKKGAKKFSNVTGRNINKRLAIVLDDVVFMAPQINDKIPSGEAQITGLTDLNEAHDLAIVLKAGNLPAPVEIVEERTVGPTLGQDSINSGFTAAVTGLAIVALFMLIYYKLSGFIADISLLVNVGFILSVLTLFEGVLTLPGIAGIILTIGMSVDANVLIFERIREELSKGKTVRTAVDGGFARAMVTILDANITTLITAIVLYQFGTGPIQGFALTLMIGIVGSMFSAILFSKAIFDTLITNKKREKLSI